MPRRNDNQGRDLDASKRYLEAEAQRSLETASDAHQRHLQVLEICPYADWTTVEGVLCLRSGTSNFVAVPCNGAATPARAESSRAFDIILLEPRELVTQLKRKEVRSWLWHRHVTERGL